MESNTIVAVAVLHMIVLYVVNEDERKKCLERKRLHWKHHSQLLLNEGQFRQYYRMSFRAFEGLVTLLTPRLQVNEAQSRRRTGIDPLSPVNKAQLFISWLAGYSFHPIRTLAGSSKTSFYNSIHQVMDAIQNHDDLQLHFPVTEHEEQKAAEKFARLSSDGVLTGCVGAVDGWLCDVQVPRRSEVKRVTSFFSGHYQCYGVNVQACVDHHCRFTAISCKCPGGMGDALAYEKWNLSSVAEQFRKGLYLVGDNAYSNNNTLLTPFTKPKTKPPIHDSFDFHLSQLRIRVEMAFELLINKWCVFKQPLKVRMKNVKKVVNVACILHNWCINQRLSEEGVADIDTDEDMVEAIADLHANESEHDCSVAPCDLSEYRRLYRSSQVDPKPTVDAELVRSTILYKLDNINKLRPAYNAQRAAATAG